MLDKIDRYEIIAELGRGGMASVFHARDPRFGREVALKLLPPALFGSEKARIRFAREVELTANLEHPHIARVYASGLQQGLH